MKSPTQPEKKKENLKIIVQEAIHEQNKMNADLYQKTSFLLTREEINKRDILINAFLTCALTWTCVFAFRQTKKWIIEHDVTLDQHGHDLKLIKAALSKKGIKI